MKIRAARSRKGIIGMSSVVVDFFSLLAIVLILVIMIGVFSIAFKGCGRDKIMQTISSNITEANELDYDLMNFLRTEIPGEGPVYRYIADNYEKDKKESLQKLDDVTRYVFNRLESCEENEEVARAYYIKGYSIAVSEKRNLNVAADGFPKIHFESEHYERGNDKQNSVIAFPLKDNSIVYVRLGLSKKEAEIKDCIELNKKNQLKQKN